jgi:hypothetical protein
MNILPVLFAIVNSEKIIKNTNIPSCRNCVHYKPSYYSTDFTASYNKCNKFGDKNIVTDEIIFDYADLCRKNEKKCGIEGKYFLLEKNIDFKIINHQIISSLPNVFFVSSIILFFIVIIAR